uniref:Uncharacterized protein n=1 Tax=Pipistrellus kuhlii TaxID=59472 RepID=A0A7J8B2D0_PIPKU|nr:hypothetical protein mPipKuh1_007726 [Pipistrellus kuhlii]
MSQQHANTEHCAVSERPAGPTELPFRLAGVARLLSTEPGTKKSWVQFPISALCPGCRLDPQCVWGVERGMGRAKACRRQPIDDVSFFFFFLIYFIDFVQRGRERDRELETSMRESHRSVASCTLPTGDMPATKVHALDQNRTRVPSVPKPTLYPLS